MMLCGTVLLLTALSAIVVFQLTPRYTATAKVMIDPRENQVLNIDSVISGLPTDMEGIESEIEVLQSRGLAQRVVTQLHLYNDPELNPRLRPKSVWAKHLAFDRWVPDSILNLFDSSQADKRTDAERLDRERVEIIDQFLRQLSITRGGRSRAASDISLRRA